MVTNPINVLWVADIVAECATAVVVYRRRAYSTYPVFFSLLLFMCVNSFTLAAMSMFHMRLAYFYAYWIGSAVRTMFLGGVMGELASAVFRPLGWFPDRSLRTCVVASAIVVVLSVLLSVPLTRDSSIQYNWSLCALAGTANEINSWACLIIQASMVVLWLLFPVSWNRRALGITLGLLIEFWVGSVAASAAALLGTALRDDMDWVRLIAFIVTNCIWIASFVMPESRTPTLVGSSHFTEGVRV